MAFSWAILSKPNGSVATLSDAASPRPSFTPDVAGLYAIQVQLRDQTGLASYATALVSTLALPPVADAGPDKLADVNWQAQVSAAASSGDALQYKWSLLGYGRSTTSTGEGDDDHHGDDGHYRDDKSSACSDDDRYDDHGSWYGHDDGSSSAHSPANGSAAVSKATIAAPTTITTGVTLDSGTIPLNQAVLAWPVALPFTGTDAGQNNSGLRLTALGVIPRAPGGMKTIWQLRNSSTHCRTVTLAAVGNGFTVKYTLPPRTELTVASPLAAGTATHKLLEDRQQRDVKGAMAQIYADVRPVGTGVTPTAFAVFQVAVSNTAGSSADTVLVTTGNVAPVVRITGPASLYPPA